MFSIVQIFQNVNFSCNGKAITHQYHMILQKYADFVLKKGFLLKKAVMLSNSVRKKQIWMFFYSVKYLLSPLIN